MASSARLDELKKKFDENPRRYFAPLANEFRKMGDVEQAIMICEEFLPQQAGHMSGHIVYGQALYEAGRLEDARTVFETALTLDPENLIALRHLGDIAKGNGELETARHWYTRVLDADPRNEEIQQLLYTLDETPAVVLDETTLVPGEGKGGGEGERRFAPPPPAIPELPKTSAYAPPPPAIPQLPREETATSSFAPPPPAAALPAPAAPVVAAPAPAPLDLDLEDALSPESMPTSVSPVPHAASAPATSLEGLEPTATGEIVTPVGRAEGLESSEFVPPPSTGPSLIESLDAGEFTAPATSVAPLAGLEETRVGGALAPPAAAATPELPPLDLDDGLTLPPQGDAVNGSATSAPASSPAPAAPSPPVERSPLPPLPATEEFAVPDASARQPKAPSGRSTSVDLSGLPELDVTPSPRAAEPPPEIPAELPPAVIAAEAELVYLVPPDDAELAPAAPPPEPPPAALPPEPPPVAAKPFVTETMAELYLKQGFRDKSLDVYRQLLAASPHDERLRARIAELEAAPAARPADSGPTVREFLGRFATLRPGARAAAAAPPSADDFASFTPATSAAAVSAEPQWSAPAPEPTPTAAPAARPSGATRTPTSETRPSGSIDALFGNRATSSDDSAASALAQAFGGAVEAPSMSGRPARAAAKELSLDSVFRDSGARAPRPSGSFSFDQFFSESAAPAAAERPSAPTTGSHETGAPAERTADDISQFNSWLQGLKQR